MSDPFWAYLERLPGKSAALFDWDMALSGWDRYPLFRDHFLQLTKSHATAVDCPTECGLGCPRCVVTHAKTNIRAICNEKEYAAVQLTTKQTLIYRLKQTAINGAICAALGIEHRESKLDGLPHTWRLGDFIPTAGMDFPVVLTMQDSKDALVEVVRSLCLSTLKPFVLIAPTRLHLSPAVETLLAQRNSPFIALNEELHLGDSPRFLTHRDKAAIFAPLIGQVPEPDSGGTVFFPTPPGTTWPQIKIQFRDGHTVTIWAGNQSGRYTYTQMGMASRKNGNPTEQWKLLEGFANSRGQIDWHSRYASDKLKKQKQELSKHLREFFRLDDDPIEWVKDTKTYRCKFRILPEGAEVY
jgi:hypothetical protein